MKKTLLTGAALLALWAASLGLSYVDLGAASLPIALVIAVAKASLVALLFMELAQARSSLRLTALTAAALVAVFVGLATADVLTRDAPPLPPPSAR